MRLKVTGYQYWSGNCRRGNILGWQNSLQIITFHYFFKYLSVTQYHGTASSNLYHATSGTTVTLASFSDRRILFNNFLLCISLSWNAEHVLFNVRQKHSLETAYAPSHQSLLISWTSVHFIRALAVSSKQNLSIPTKPLGESQHNFNFMTNEFKMTPGEAAGNIKRKTGGCDDFLFTFLCKTCWDISFSRDIISFAIMEKGC